MARNESPREDLMDEATALLRRIEWQLPGEKEPVVAGLRRGGATSIYFGSDPAFHLDEAGKLKRAFSGGFLYRTQGETLARLDRQRDATSTWLVRHDLTASELAEFRESMASRLRLFFEAIPRARILRQVPVDDTTVGGEIESIFQQFLEQGAPLAPAFAGKR